MAATIQLEWLAGGGEMAELIARLDWSGTALGPIDRWPQSLRTTVSLCLASNFPINIIWGDGHNQIYNDGYRIVCGAAHPRAMGQDYRVTWASAWPAIGEPFEHALAGNTTYLENQRMFLERNGYPEETFFTFSLSPIRDESGAVVGLFHPVTETTATMLAERRTRALRDIADTAGRAAVFGDACDLLRDALGRHVFDVPLALVYLVTEGRDEARLRAGCGTPAGSPFAPDTMSWTGDLATAGWPLADAAKATRMLRVDDVVARFGARAAGEYPEPITTAFVVPLRAAGLEAPMGFLVIGASPRLPVDEAYVGFIEMVGAAAASALSNARAYELERQRAEGLAQLDRAKSAFFSNVSHEFRTPLTLMLGPLEDVLMRRHGDVSAEVRHELEVIQRNGLRLLKLVNALLDFSRIEAGRAETSLQSTDLSALTREVASAFESAVERAGMRLAIDVEPLGAPMLVDRDMWEKIVLNLVSNAFKFTHQGEIRVMLRRTGERVELAVRDTGIGIAANEIARVFDRFHRIQGAAGRTHEGSGIGLALVRDLAVLHGGSVHVESTPGAGSTFFVRIPFRTAQGPATVAMPPQSHGASAGEMFVSEAARWLPDVVDAAPANGRSLANAPRILVADDNADMRAYVQRLLEARYRVTVVTNGAEALESAQHDRPDLLLSDVMMPVLDGAQLVQQIRAHPTLRTLPVILLSARAGDDETASSLELGADDYLTKPFSTRELLARVQTQLAMAALRVRVSAEEARAAALSERQRELRTLLEARDEFLSIASHELQTPLTSLTLQFQMTAHAITESPGRNLPPERLERMIRIAREQVARLASLVEDLLDVARCRTGRLSIDVADVDLAALTREAVERMTPSLTRAGCTVRLDVPTSVTGRWDGRRIEQIVGNLLSNVIRYAAGRPVEVGVRDEADRVTLEVRDHGAGVPASLHETIFDRFDRGLASRNAGGLGLGLFITRQLVAAHGGTIRVADADGGGASFTVELPRAARVEPATVPGDT